MKEFVMVNNYACEFVKVVIVDNAEYISGKIIQDSGTILFPDLNKTKRDYLLSLQSETLIKEEEMRLDSKHPP